MLLTTQEIIVRLSECQDRIWETTTTTVTESGTELSFSSPLTVSSKLTDLAAEFPGRVATIQFAFADDPEAYQMVLVPVDLVADMVALATGNPVAEVDESSLASIRTALEAIVQGICLAVGTMKSAPVVATGLAIRLQELVWPPNMEGLSELVRMQVAVSGNGVAGSLTWMLDPQSAASVIGANAEAASEPDSPFLQMAAGGMPPGMSPVGASNSLDLLLDIPLEITVELGRMKMLVRDVIELGTGSIVEIDKAAGEPVDVMVNGRLFAKGEVVVIEDNFGVRITEVVSPNERLMRLAEVA